MQGRTQDQWPLCVGSRENRQSPKSSSIDPLKLVLENFRTLLRTDLRGDGFSGFERIEAVVFEIDDETILTNHGRGVDDVTTDERVDDLTELCLHDSRPAVCLGSS